MNCCAGVRQFIAFSLIVAVASCKKQDAQTPLSLWERVRVRGSVPAEQTPSIESPVTPLTPEALQPLIQEIGAPGVVPVKIAVEFAHAVVDEKALNRPLKNEVEFSISPKIDGNCTYTSASTLTFVPNGAFGHATRYLFKLLSVKTDTGVVRAPPSAASWTHEFTTPMFRLVSVEAHELELDKNKVVADVVFSGEVDARSLGRFATFSLGDNALSEVTISPTDRRHVVRAAIHSPGLRPSAEIKLKLKSGLPNLAGNAKAAADEASFKLFGGSPADIKVARMKESNNGFYVDIRCDDRAVKERQYYYDREDGSYEPNISRRCMLQEAEAARGIHFVPPVKFSIGPSRAGFRILGEFKRGHYHLRIDSGLITVDGGVVSAPFEKDLAVSARKPQVSFTASGRYLPRSAWKNLAIRHLNVDSVKLQIRNVPPENLIFWMGDDHRETADERTSNLILTKVLPVKNAPDAHVTTWVDVGSMLPKTTKGILELKIESSGAQASTRLLLTDLSLVAKRSRSDAQKPDSGSVYAWAVSMDTGDPLDGVEISLVRRSGFVVARCTTGGKEGCPLKVPAGDSDPSMPFALIARKGDDLTYLKYSELRTEISESDVQGEPYLSERPYRAAIYSDRGVYRPGDTAHFAAIVRDQSSLAPRGGVPVELKLVDPREKVAKRIVVKTNGAGMLTYDYPFAAFADTGKYQLQLFIAEKRLGDYAFSVEEFVPERMKLTVVPSKSGYRIDETVSVALEAKYLFGGTPEGNAVDLTCRLEPAQFRPKENANFTFGVFRESPAAKGVELGQVHGTLSQVGQATLECASLGRPSFPGPAKLVATAAVLEAGSGRSTQSQATSLVHRERYYIGLQSGTQRMEAGVPLRVQGVVVDWEGKILPHALKSIDVELQHLDEEYDWYWDEAEGTEHGHRLRHPVVEGRVTVPVEGGKFTVSLTPSNGYGGYLVRAKMGGTYTDLEFEGQSNYWWEPSEHRAELTPRPARPTFLNLQVPTQTKVGENVSISFKAPYRGSLLLTAETHVLVASEWRKINSPGNVSWTFKVPEFVPNIYVSAFLIKDPHLESKASFIPDRAFGVASIGIEPTDFTQSVVLRAPAEVRSNSELSVNLDLGKLEGEVYATVAAVDEGILQLTRFQSPDPFSALFSKRALGVETFETIGWTLLLPPSGNSRSTGGDGDGSSPNGRVQPVKPVALWSGVVRVPETGQATVKFNVPQYRGALRVMAVVAGPKRLGRASKSVLVRDPLVVQSTLPRFLTDGDQIQIPVFVTNMSDRVQDVQVRLTAEGLPVPGLEELEPSGAPVRFTGKQVATIKLEPGKAGTVAFQAVAARSVGAAKFRVLVKGGDFESHDEADVPFVPSGPRTRETQRIALQVGKNDLAHQIKGWVPTSERSTIWVTSNPYGESFEHLRWLVQYPYGCIEQTTSSTRPLLFVSELIGSVDPTLLASNKVEDMVMHGINRILSMQTPSGGFAYWPGSTETNGWGTAYATHLLLDAQKLGYPVPQDRLNEALTWLSSEVASYESGRVTQEFRHDDAFRDTEAYAHYVLAMAGKAHKARILRLVEQMPPHPTGEPAEQMYGLKAALFLAGDRRYERDLKQPDTSAISEDRTNSWSFYSDRRRRGFMLSVFQDLFGSDPAGEELAERVADSLSGHPSNWYTTQEVVWSVTGLGKRLHGTAKNFKTPSLFANGKSVSPRPQTGNKSSDRTWALARASEYKSLQVSLEDKGQGTVYAIVSSEGIKQHASVSAGGNGLKLTRHYRTLDGKELDVARDLLKLGDLIFVEVSLTNTSGDLINNIALVDRLPAGWEIENPRLGRGQQINWLAPDKLWKADYLNVRDDRVEYFGSLRRGETRSVVYAVRCVTAGKFTIPAVEAEAMYDPRIWARQLGGRTEVQGPWADYLL